MYTKTMTQEPRYILNREPRVSLYTVCIYTTFKIQKVWHRNYITLCQASGWGWIVENRLSMFLSAIEFVDVFHLFWFSFPFSVYSSWNGGPCPWCVVWATRCEPRAPTWCRVLRASPVQSRNSSPAPGTQLKSSTPPWAAPAPSHLFFWSVVVTTSHKYLLHQCFLMHQFKGPVCTI